VELRRRELLKQRLEQQAYTSPLRTWAKLRLPWILACITFLTAVSTSIHGCSTRTFERHEIKKDTANLELEKQRAELSLRSVREQIEEVLRDELAVKASIETQTLAKAKIEGEVAELQRRVDSRTAKLVGVDKEIGSREKRLERLAEKQADLVAGIAELEKTKRSLEAGTRTLQTQLDEMYGKLKQTGDAALKKGPGVTINSAGTTQGTASRTGRVAVGSHGIGE